MTVHIAGARAILDRMMADPDGPGVIYSATQGLRTGRWSDEYVDSIGQMGIRSRSSWPMEQVAAFATIHGMIHEGKIAMVPVSTNGAPHGDKEREANAAGLASLPHPFTASVNMLQNNGDYDGTVYWSEPIEVSVCTGISEEGPDGPQCIPQHIMIPEGEAPLEIGSSLPSRTWFRLAKEGGFVARWPYGHDCFRLFVNLDYTKALHEWADSIDPSRRVDAPAQGSLW